MAESDDAPPTTGDVMGNLPRTRPGRRSARRASSVDAPADRATAATVAAGKTAPRRSRRAAPTTPPVPPAPRSGWATPRADDAADPGHDVTAVVGEAVRRGERLVRGVLRRLTP